MSSYETAAEHALAIHRRGNYPFRVNVVKPYYDDAGYLQALAESIRPYLGQEFDHLYSATTAFRADRKGDITGKHCLQSTDCCGTDSPAYARCYRYQCLRTTSLVAGLLGLARNTVMPFSRGWAAMNGSNRIPRKDWKNCRKKESKTTGRMSGLVSDCFETLEEIAMRGKESFIESSGGEVHHHSLPEYKPLWVSAIAGWIRSYQNGNKSQLLPREPCISTSKRSISFLSSPGLRAVLLPACLSTIPKRLNSRPAAREALQRQFTIMMKTALVRHHLAFGGALR